MITLKILMKIIMACSFDIDPTFDKNHCAMYLTKCNLEKSGFEACLDFYEPVETDAFGGNPSDADWSY